MSKYENVIEGTKINSNSLICKNKHNSDSDDCIKNELSSEQIRSNRKIMSSLLKQWSSMKSSSIEEILKFTSDYLKSSCKDIINLYDEDKNTLSHLLIEEEKLEPLKIIIETYYLVLNNKDEFYKWFTWENKEDWTVLELSAQKGNIEIIKYLYEIVSRTDETKIRWTEKRNSIFHSAAKRNQSYSIIFFYEKLQKYFPNIKIIDVENQYKITPLHYACYNKCKNAIDLLLDLGADINSIDIEGKSVWYYAVYSGCPKIVKKLLIRGADKTIKDNQGKTPYDLAVDNNYSELQSVLSSKNCWMRNVFQCSEIGPIKGIRHDYILIHCFLWYILFGILFSYRFWHSYQLNYSNKTNSETKTFIRVLLMCFSISSFFVILSTFMSSYFMCCWKRKKHRGNNNNKNRAKSLISLFEENANVCVKCMIPIKYDTIHCWVCDVCVEKWDHHCFWLNTCIDKFSKFKFILFFTFVILSLLSNLGAAIILCFFTYHKNFKREFFIDFFCPIISQSCLKEKEELLFTIISYCYWVIFSGMTLFILLPIFGSLCSKQPQIINESTWSQFEDKWWKSKH